MSARASARAASHRTATAFDAADPDRLGRLFGEMMSHLHRRSAGDTLQMMSEHGLTMAQMVTLHSLVHLSVQSVSAIAQILRLSLPATSHLVERLVRAGLVQRTEDPEDRRAKRVMLTPRGLSFVRKLEAARVREVAQVFNHLSAAARDRLSETLALVIEELASGACPPARPAVSGSSSTLAPPRAVKAWKPGPGGRG